MKLIQRNRTAYYKCGNVANIILVGSPTLSGTVISGFSSSKYAHTPLVPQNVKSYEMVAKFTTGAIDGTQQGILANSTTNRRTPQICISTSNTLNFDHPKDADTWVAVGNITASANTTYWTKAVWDGSYAYFYYKTSESANWTFVNKKAVNSVYWTEQIGIGIDGKTLPFKGSIDLQKCYIKINGKMWWTGTIPYEVTIGAYDFSEDKLTYLTLKEKRTIYYKYGTTPNATIIGSPTVNNGVMSGFSSANYGILPICFKPDSNPWEIVFKFKTGTVVTGTQPLLGPTATYKGFYLGVAESYIYFTASANGTSYGIAKTKKGVTKLTASTTYWAKLEFTGTTYNLYLSTNGTNFNLEASVSNSSKVYQGDGVLTYIGKGVGDSTYVFTGSIDFPKSYINIKGKLWWNGTVAEKTTSGDYDYSLAKTVCLGVR